MQGISLGTFRGIDIRLHPSFLVVFLWVLVDWRRFGDQRGGSPVWFGVLFVVLVFAAVLAHEFGHALMARHFGVTVHDITLSLIGGVARMGPLPHRPGSEIAIAFAGPAVNVAVAVLVVPLAILTLVLSGSSGVDDIGRQLFRPGLLSVVLIVVFSNLLLAVLNLVPAFPMDGGRILRAVLAERIGREQGTVVAVRFGQVLAAVLGIAAAVWLRSLALPLIAAFLIFAAQLELQSVRIEYTLRRLKVGQFAVWDMGGVSPDQTLAWALRGGPRDVVVTEHGKVVGMLWRNILLDQLGASSSNRLVRDAMDPTVRSVTVDDSIYDVEHRMAEADRWAVPVTEDGTYRGIFTADRLSHVYRQLSPEFSRNPGIRLSSAVSEFLRGFAR